MSEDMIAWACLGCYIIIDICKHIITLGFKMIDKQIEKNNKK